MPCPPHGIATALAPHPPVSSRPKRSVPHTPSFRAKGCEAKRSPGAPGQSRNLFLKHREAIQISSHPHPPTRKPPINNRWVIRKHREAIPYFNPPNTTTIPTSTTCHPHRRDAEKSAVPARRDSRGIYFKASRSIKSHNIAVD